MSGSPHQKEGDGVRGRVFLLIFIGIFGVSVIATYLYGVKVVNSVKEQAKTSDAALRTTGYAILVAVSEDGEFPGTPIESATSPFRPPCPARSPSPRVAPGPWI